MERKTLIASLDVLSQEFTETDPMAKDLRTMAYVVANMSDEELEKRVAGNPWIEHMNKVRKSNPGKSFKEIASLAKKTFKKAEEAPEKEVDFWSKKASDAVQRALVAEIAGEACDEKKKEEKDASCGKPHEKEEEKKKPAKEEPKKEAAKEEPKKEAAEPEKEAKEEATEVDTLLLKSSTDFGGIQLEAGMVTMDDIGDLSDVEQKRLDLLFQ